MKRIRNKGPHNLLYTGRSKSRAGDQIEVKMPKVFPASYPDNAKVMIFVDGENLSIRFKSFIESEQLDKLEDHIGYEKDVYV